MGKPGRPLKLTGEVWERFIDAIRDGLSDLDACKVAGVDNSTWAKAKTRGRRAKSGRFRQMILEYERATADSLAVAAALAKRGLTQDTVKSVRTVDRKTMPDGSVIETTKIIETRTPPSAAYALKYLARRSQQWAPRRQKEDDPADALPMQPRKIFFLDPPTYDADGNPQEQANGQHDPEGHADNPSQGGGVDGIPAEQQDPPAEPS